MIACPHCGETIFAEPEGLSKLSPNQRKIYLMFAENPQRVWTTIEIASRLYAADPNGGPLAIREIIQTNIHHIRKRMGDVIETTNAGYRLRMER